MQIILECKKALQLVAIYSLSFSVSYHKYLEFICPIRAKELGIHINLKVCSQAVLSRVNQEIHNVYFTLCQTNSTQVSADLIHYYKESVHLGKLPMMLRSHGITTEGGFGFVKVKAETQGLWNFSGPPLITYWLKGQNMTGWSSVLEFTWR